MKWSESPQAQNEMWHQGWTCWWRTLLNMESQSKKKKKLKNHTLRKEYETLENRKHTKEIWKWNLKAKVMGIRVRKSPQWQQLKTESSYNSFFKWKHLQYEPVTTDFSCCQSHWSGTPPSRLHFIYPGQRPDIPFCMKTVDSVCVHAISDLHKSLSDQTRCAWSAKSYTLLEASFQKCLLLPCTFIKDIQAATPPAAVSCCINRQNKSLLFCLCNTENTQTSTELHLNLLTPLCTYLTLNCLY